MNYMLKLKDHPGKRENSKFKDCCLYYVRQMEDGKGGMWEYSPVTQFDKAMLFPTQEAAFEVAVLEHALNAFHAQDRLFIVETNPETMSEGIEIEIARGKMDKKADQLNRQWEREARAKVKAEREARKLAKKQAKAQEQLAVALAEPAEEVVPAETYDIHTEIVELTAGIST